MDDLIIELIAIISIIAGLCLGFFLIFDYTPVNAFFLEENDNNAYLEGIIIEKTNKVNNYTNTNEQTDINSTYLRIYACADFNAYYEKNVDKLVNDFIIINGEFNDDFFIIQNYS